VIFTDAIMERRVTFMIKITYKRSGVEDYREFRNKEEFEDWLDRQKKIEEITIINKSES
jgi:hypothetical protein